MGIMGDVINLAEGMGAMPGSTVALFLPSGDPPWTTPLRDSLVGAGFQVSTAERLDDLLRLLNLQPIDAIIAADNGDCFDALGHRNDGRDPLHVLVSSEMLDDEPHANADLVWPPHPRSLIKHLSTLLKLRLENAALRLQAQQSRLLADQLQADNESLIEENDEALTLIEQQEQHLFKYRMASDDITILRAAIVQNVSHELRTPLIQVKSAVALLAEVSTDERIATFAIQATARLEDRIKDVSQLSSSSEVHFNPLIVRDLFKQSLRKLGQRWNFRTSVNRVDMLVPPDLPPVLGDAPRLLEVMGQLLENAIKFSPEHTRVEISAELVDQQMLISVRDYGIGIDEDQFERIFEMFYQVDSSSTRRYGGMGIGLTIVKHNLELHNTFCMVESQPGKGSTFSFMLQTADLRSGWQA
jgi:signal transduction histidine kinase